MPRLYIGSYVIDSADTSSSSTTSGVQLDLDEEDGARPVIRDAEYQWPVMYAVVTAGSEAALKTAVDAVRDAIRNCAGKDVKYEETNGTTLYNMPASIWPDAEAEIEPDYDGLTCDIAFRITGRNAGPLASGAADEAGQIGPIEWQYEETGGGIAGMVVNATFGPTLSGDTVTTGSRENAVAFINKMLNTANYPAWLSTNFRCVGIAPIAFDQKPNQASIGESSYDPCVVSMAFRELDSTLAADAGWPSEAVSGNWRVDMRERDPIDVRSGQIDPGNDITLFGDLLLKTEGNSTFNSSASKLADSEIEAKAEAAVAAMIRMFTAVYASLTPVQVGNAILNIDAIQGVVSFTVTFIASGRILRWNESGTLRNSWLKVRSRAANGKDWRYVNAGGPVKVLTHSLLIETQDSPEPYRAPPLQSGWDQDDVGVTPATEVAYRNGYKTFTTFGEQQWTYMNDGPKQVDPNKQTVANKVLTWGNIGTGDLL